MHIPNILMLVPHTGTHSPILNTSFTFPTIGQPQQLRTKYNEKITILEDIDEAKPGCGHILGFSDAGELLTLPNVDSNLTPLSAMLFILTALILGMIFEYELYRVAYRILEKPSVFRQ